MTNKQKYKQLTKQLDKLRKQLRKEEKDALISKLTRKYVGKYFLKTYGKYGNVYTSYFHVLSVGVDKNSYPMQPEFTVSAIYVSPGNLGYDSRNAGFEINFVKEITKEAWLKAKQKLKDSIV